MSKLPSLVRFCWAGGILLWLVVATEAKDGCGTVYVSYTVDTEAKPPASLGIYSDTLNLIDFASGGVVDTVMNLSGRWSYRDSYGNAPKYTWLLRTDQFYCQSAAHDCQIVYSSMEPYFATATNWGDIFGWHYHNIDWSDPDNDGVSYWNQLLTFDSTQYTHGSDISMAEELLSRLIIDKGFYPAVFRSGWTWENNDFSRWLDDIVPFDFSNIAPRYSPQNRPDSLQNIYDWLNAPGDWNFYHPDTSDYQLPGSMKRTIFRSSVYSWDFNTAFYQADSGRDQFLVTYTHTYSGAATMDYSQKLASLQSLFPCVTVKFVTALEGARIMLGLNDTILSLITVTQNRDTFVVSSDKPLFTFPYAALKDAGGVYRRVHPASSLPDTLAGQWRWTFDLSDLPTTSRPASLRFAGVTTSGATFVAQTYTVMDNSSDIADDSRSDLPTAFVLLPNYPNPFNGETVISFHIPMPAQVNVRIINEMGQTVRTLVDRRFPAGTHSVKWNGTDDAGRTLASGVYVCQLLAGGHSQARKMMLLK